MLNPRATYNPRPPRFQPFNRDSLGKKDMVKYPARYTIGYKCRHPVGGYPANWIYGASNPAADTPGIPAKGVKLRL